MDASKRDAASKAAIAFLLQFLLELAVSEKLYSYVWRILMSASVSDSLLKCNESLSVLSAMTASLLVDSNRWFAGAAVSICEYRILRFSGIGKRDTF